MSQIRPFKLEMGDWSLAGRLHLPPSGPVKGLAIVAHGLYSDMSSVKHRAFCELLAARGLAAARFDARGCGESSGRIGETTLTGRAEATLAVRGWLMAETGLSGPLVLVGSSFGGATILLTAALMRDKGLAAPAALIPLAAPCDFLPLVAKWEEIRQEEMDRAYFDDLSGLDMPDCLKGLGPMLIIHAVEDEVIPVEQAQMLLKLAGPGSRLALLHGSDHALHAPGATQAALAEAATFLERLFPGA